MKRLWSFIKRLLHLAAPEIPIPVPDTLKEIAMSFSISLFGAVVSEAEGEAARIEAAILGEVRELIAKYDALKGGSFSGDTVSADLAPAPPAEPAPVVATIPADPAPVEAAPAAPAEAAPAEDPVPDQPADPTPAPTAPVDPTLPDPPVVADAPAPPAASPSDPAAPPAA